jgi:serine/threonine protein phosphatase 1
VKIYALGDLHGMAGLLSRALAFIAADAREGAAQVIFLGDYVDRGSDSKGVLDLLVAGPPNPMHTWIPLKGNHDQFMSDALAGDEAALDDWLYNGGLNTLASFGLSMYEWDRIPERYAAFLRSLPLTYEDDHRIFVHAGLRPGIPLNEQEPNDLLWIREPFLGAHYDFGTLVVHGHTPARHFEYRPPYRLNLDTGAAYGGKLTVAIWEGEDPKPRFCQWG